MLLLELTRPTAAENLAIDEALLLNAESGAGPANILRIWEPPHPMVVIGRGSKIEQETDRAYCEQENIPVLRRISGGATIVAGPGCLMYAVILSHTDHPASANIDAAHQYVLNPIAAAINAAKQENADGQQPIAMAGTSDLVLATDEDSSLWRKVSGNSMRRSRTCSLVHGTLLYEMDLSWVSKCLRTPPRMPDYRQQAQPR